MDFYVSEDEEEVESDLLVVARFAQLDVTPSKPQAMLGANGLTDPSEIELLESNNKTISTGNEPTFDGSTSSSSSSSSSEDEILERNQELGDDDGSLDGSEDNEKPIKSFEALTQNEQPYSAFPLEPLPPQGSVDQSDAMRESLKIITANGNVIVASSLGIPVLDTGSVVATTNKILIGRIDDVFGPVVSPFYTVRIMCDEPRPILQVGDVLCWVEKFSVIVNCATLNTKGTDASNMVDEEISESESEEDESDSNDASEIPGTKAGAEQFTGYSRQKQSSIRGRQRLNGNRGMSSGNLNRRRQDASPRQGRLQQAKTRIVASAVTEALPRANVPLQSAAIYQQTNTTMQAPSLQLLATPVYPPGWPVPQLPSGWPSVRF